VSVANVEQKQLESPWFRIGPEQREDRISRRGRGLIGIAVAFVLWFTADSDFNWILGWMAANAALLGWLPTSIGRGSVTLSIGVVSGVITGSVLGLAPDEASGVALVSSLVLLIGTGAFDLYEDGRKYEVRRTKWQAAASAAPPRSQRASPATRP
jgi:hypothetical protein